MGSGAGASVAVAGAIGFVGLVSPHLVRALVNYDPARTLIPSALAGLQPGALAAERAALERATGLEIGTTRQHLLHWDVRRTPRLQEAAGLRVDSSLGFNRGVGFRAGTSLPSSRFIHISRREQTSSSLLSKHRTASAT